MTTTIRPTPAASTSAQDPDEWPEYRVDVAPSLPRLDPQRLYVARTIGYDTFSAYKRRVLVLLFDVYDRDQTSTVLARLPMYFRLPPKGKPLRPTAKLARVFDLIAHRMTRTDRLPLNVLRYKLWSIAVRDVEVSADHGNPLHPANRYSVVDRIVERLA